MKITFSNLGAIKKTTLDLRPLTVIIGPNNSNKTYIAYSIYGLLKDLNQSGSETLLSQLGYDVNYSNSLPNDELDKLYKLDAEGNYSYKIDTAFFSAYLKDCQQITRMFEEHLNVFFQDTNGNLFNNTKYEFIFTKDELVQSIKDLINNHNSFHPINKAYEYVLEKNTFHAQFVSNSLFERNTPNNYVASGLSFELKSFLYPKPILLPAERNALIITYKILENRRYDLLKNVNRELFTNSNLKLKNPPRFFGGEINHLQQDIRYPQPIEDFLDFLRRLEAETNLETEGKFGEFAKRIEKDIQKGNKTNYNSTTLGGREIKINVNKDLDIDLYNASSSIKQLAPLLLYLRYRAQEGDLLIIDEPEMNLHPESQAKLLEVLGMLVNAGVNVLLTTHSPYFMSHLNNLIAGDVSDDKTRAKQAKSLYLGDERAFLKPEDVSAYEMRQNKKGEQTLHDLHDKDYGIRWETLSDVSADIQQKFFEIYEKKEAAANGEEKAK